MEIEAIITNLVEQKFQEPTFEDCFLVEVNHGKGNRLEVFIDSDAGISFEQCQKVSRFLEAHLDEHKWIGEEYVLEVSSPGISRPLKFARQYVKNIGRTLSVTNNEGATKEGVLLDANENFITLEETTKVKEGKKNKIVILKHEIPFEQIKKAIVKISFN